MRKAFLYSEETQSIQFDFKCGMFWKYYNHEFHWFMPKVLLFLNRNDITKLRLKGGSLNRILMKLSEITGDNNFMYMASLYEDEYSLNVYTMHAFTARKLEGTNYFSRRDEVDDHWQALDG